jgi:hypothetical protein
MPTKRKQPQVAPLKLDLAELRKKLALLKLGKLFTPYKKAKKRRSARQSGATQVVTR